MKKQLTTKFAALCSAALFAFNGVQSLTASAATYTTYTQNTLTSAYHMADFVRHESMKFPNGRYWNNVNNPDGWTYSQCAHHPAIHDNMSASEFDCCGRVSAGNMYYGTYRKRINPGLEGYMFQCAGYARKLAMDYFETNYFNQIRYTQTTSYQYVPRLGDQIRISEQHTVFVTGVQKLGDYSYRVTYSDCNGVDSNHKCQIQWNKTVTLNRYTGGYGSSAYDVMGFYSSTGAACPVTGVTRPLLVGDVNGDSFVDWNDYHDLYYINHYGFNQVYSMADYWTLFAVCDINRDGRVNDDDANLIPRYASNGILPNYGYVKGV